VFSHCVDVAAFNYQMPGMGVITGAEKTGSHAQAIKQRWATCGDRGGTTSGNRGPTESCPARILILRLEMLNRKIRSTLGGRGGGGADPLAVAAMTWRKRLVGSIIYVIATITRPGLAGCCTNSWARAI
jgi:hypothetical protein